MTMNDSGDRKNLHDYIINNFDRAIKEGWIKTYYQPVVRTSNGRVCEEEALARWEDPEMGVLSAGDFVPALEEAGLIEKLDLHVLGQVIDKMKQQERQNLHVVSTSVNFSQVDFQSGDIVDQIDRIVSEANMAKDLIAVEVSESSVTVSREKTLSQLQRLQQLGYRIELDDCGYGDISLLLSSDVCFNNVKTNFDLVRQATENKNARIILSELVKMAGKIGMETTVKGVETGEQYDFLKEIGCSKLQGYYFSKPNSLSQIIERYRTGTQIGFEDPEERDYYAAVDKVSLHDISFIREKSGFITDLYDSLPMAVLEVDGKGCSVMRINSACEKFIGAYFPDYDQKAYVSFEDRGNIAGAYTLSSIRKAAQSDELIIIDDRTYEGKNVHIMLQRIARNPVNGKNAVLFTIISVSDFDQAAEDLSYNYIARALSEDYIASYFVDLETNRYVVYSSDGINRELNVVTRGDDFFRDAHANIGGLTYEEDLEMFNELCTKENLIKSLDERGVFSITYRADDYKGVHYVNLKAVRAKGDNKHIIIGINDVDSQIKQQQLFTQIQEERIVYSRMAALAGSLFAVYSIDIADDSYVVYKTPQGMDFIGDKRKGTDFFAETKARIKDVIHIDDLEEFEKVIRRDNVLNTIDRDGAFEHRYRLIVHGAPVYVAFRAVKITENGDPKLIVGLVNIDAQVRREAEYAETLSAVEDMALKDGLTGVKNKNAYNQAQKAFEAGEEKDYAIIVFDLNGLKYVNDNFGHHKGDEFIREGCKIICDAFAHSPVYRVGGDEFVVIAQGNDFNNMESCLAMVNLSNSTNKLSGAVTMAYGTANDSEAGTFTEVFELADARMYIQKKRMKVQ